jgi:hypothetical protein
MQMIEVMTALGDKVPIASSVTCHLEFCILYAARFTVAVQLGLALDEAALLSESMLDDAAVQARGLCMIPALAIVHMDSRLLCCLSGYFRDIHFWRW